MKEKLTLKGEIRELYKILDAAITHLETLAKEQECMNHAISMLNTTQWKTFEEYQKAVEHYKSSSESDLDKLIAKKND